jgi:hypothetical protein
MLATVALFHVRDDPRFIGRVEPLAQEREEILIAGT